MTYGGSSWALDVIYPRDIPLLTPVYWQEKHNRSYFDSCLIVYFQASDDLSAIPLKRRRSEVYNIDITKCIICQNDTSETTCSSPESRQKIIEAADIRQDEVTERLRIVDHRDFVYHVSNDCYKRYTHKKTLASLQKKKVDSNNNQETETEQQPVTKDLGLKRSTRASVTPRSPPSQLTVPVYEKKCVICSKVSYMKVKAKYRISEEERAFKFLRAVVYFQDDVYRRTSDLQDVYSVFGSDIYCHKNCIRRYTLKYDRAIEKSDCKEGNSAKAEHFACLVSKVDKLLKDGHGFTLSDLRTRAQIISGSEETFSNRDIRLFLESHYGPDLRVSRPTEANKSAMVFLNVEETEMADMIRSTDAINECASAMREALLGYSFDLQDKFCDAADLEESWDTMDIPDVVLTFLCSLFNYNKTEIKHSLETEASCPWVSNEESEEDNNLGSAELSRVRKIKSVMQILFFIINNGRQRTPLHLMCSQRIHALCKSKTFTTELNHLGLCVSYDEILRYHTDLAQFTSQQGDEVVPLPSHFSPELYTTGAFDNFDHNEDTLSGQGGSHDTVSVLYQDKPQSIQRKPRISETKVTHGAKSFKKTLKCQERHDFLKPVKKGDIPADYTVADTCESSACSMDRKDMAWSLGRMNLSEIDSNIISVSQSDGQQQMPSWSGFNSVVTDKDLPVRTVGFLPILPFPVTEYKTVYTAMKNFQNVLGQLKQERLAITCDEGVYRIARDIQLLHPEEFSDLVICLGSFHLLKIYLGCIGKYVRGSAAESIFIENDIFGQNTTEAVLNGSHYVRSLTGLTMLSESMERLQWQTFFDLHGVEKYKNSLKLLVDMKDSISTKNKAESKEFLSAFLSSSDELFSDFEAFKIEGRSKSETFLFWDKFIQMVELAKMLVRADREGDWQLHVQTVEAMLPYFAVFNCNNYLRWCSLYLEDMKKLSETAPDVKEQFEAGRFVVKRSLIPFSAVAADLCLEQTINRSAKSSGGIIGSTKKKEFVTRWNIIYHELLAVDQLFREICGVQLNNTELNVNHSFSHRQTQSGDLNVGKMISYILKHENPFVIGDASELRLHNILTKAIMPEDIRRDLISVQTVGEEIYSELRKERFVAKSKRLSDVIHRSNIKTFANVGQKASVVSNTRQKLDKKEQGFAQKKLDIARERGYSTNEIFRYDLVKTSYLFDGNELMVKPQKHELVKVLESKLTEDDYILAKQWPTSPTGYIIDVMANVRKTTAATTFGELFANFLDVILKLCRNPQRIDFIFDSYLEMSAKESERQRRSSKVPILVSSIAVDTRLPKDMETFWSSSTNKAKLQEFIRGQLINHFSAKTTSYPVFLSGFIGDGVSLSTLSIKDGNLSEHPELDSSLEEADVRIFPHGLHALRQTLLTRLVIISNDTDVVVLALYFCHLFMANGLQELWLRFGSGDKTRFLPGHVLAKRWGKQMCDVLPAAHCLTGCDITSKFGTKAAAIKADPVRYLSHFGKPGVNLQDCLRDAEAYLVHVIHHGEHDIEKMDGLRVKLYHQKKSVTLLDLPPTSHATKGHILRAFFLTYIQINCLGDLSLVPTEYGFIMQNDSLLPDKLYRSLPENMTIICNCGKCATQMCPCRQDSIRCCVFCKCQTNEKLCQNPLGVIASN